MPVFAELEFTVGPQSAPKAGYPVVPRLRVNGQDEIFPSGIWNFDLDELSNLRAEDAKYEARLSELFFQSPPAKDALDKARAQLDQAGAGNMLSVRLFIEPAAQELHHVRWECLRDPEGNPLFNGDSILFSRFLSSPNLRPISPRTQLKALVAIANPPHLDQAIDPENPQAGLAPVDVAGEKKRAESGLAAAGFALTTLAAPPNGTAPATLANILSELEKGCDVFYLVCHGGSVLKNGVPTPMLWLEDGQDPIEASGLVEGIRNMAQQPRLVVLASCQSGGAAASGTLGAIGPLLATAGVPAVIAMQGNIKMTTVDRFMPHFLAELAKDGRIDRAMGKARGGVLDCNDYWMPTLFMRLSDGLLWSQTADPVPSPPVSEEMHQIFADVSSTSANYPLEKVVDAGSQPGEVWPVYVGTWKLIAPDDKAPGYAMFSAFGNFRSVVFGHEHMLTFQDINGHSPLMDESLNWLKAAKPATILLSAKPTDCLIKFPTNNFSLQLLQDQLTRRGYHVDTTTTLADKQHLAQYSIVMIPNAWGDFSADEIAAIDDFLTKGGGLPLAAGVGWSWPHALTKYPMNVLFKPYDARWTNK